MAQPGNARFVGERLGQFVAASRWHALPQALRREGKRSLLNFTLQLMVTRQNSRISLVRIVVMEQLAGCCD